MIKVSRIPFIALALLCLITGLWTGLSRIGWDLFVLPATAHHGAIMVGGFLGTLISIEKIIPLKKKVLFLIPVSSALSVLFFIINQPLWSIMLLILASSGLILVFTIYLIRERSLIYTLMLAGAINWLIGNILLLTKNFYPLAFPWWLGFILFVITAERLELIRFLPVSALKKKFFVGFLVSFVIGVGISFHGIGNMVSGLSLVATSIWLMRNDLIGITIKKNGLPKFVAISLLCGYLALLLTGILFVTRSEQMLAYDAIVHTFFLGFVFSMIFAHGPIILPGVLGSSVQPFHKILYLWLFVLQSSWLIRIFADAFMATHWRKMTGIISALAIVAYFVTIATLTYRRQHAKLH
ncbi:hypothetical protein [Chryseolinea sp. H1M3-3]|uniref:hypothetical protein n=1 Tax=Chryseolinea sp. H1M3-3 TaxID=3034144 RepID=UPI0023EAC400|nr:hypothetical protein [Chryseolinea sp. H1M3-3]